MRAHLSGTMVAMVVVVSLALVGGLRVGTDQTSNDEPDIERGSRLYDSYCVECHGGATGGSITDIPPPHNANGHTWHHADCELKDIILDGSDETTEAMREMRGVPDSVPVMPAFDDVLSEEEVKDILAHIKTWWTEQQREWQARATQALC